MKNNILICAFILLTTSSGIAELEQAVNRVILAQPVQEVPELDGIIEETIWSRAEWSQGFTVLGSGEPAQTETEFAVSFDAQNLYVAIRCFEPSMDKLLINATERGDERLYEDDGIEIFIAPGGQRNDYYQFQLNAAGVIAESAGYQSGVVRDLDWGSRFEAATHHEADQWTAEIVIPLVDLELGASVEEDWGVNVTRVRYAGGPRQLSSFVPLTGSFHQPGRFAALRLPGADFSHLRWEIRFGDTFAIIKEESGKIAYTEIELHNATSEAWSILLQPRLKLSNEEAVGSYIEAELEAGQTGAFTVAVPFLDNGPQTFEVSVREKEAPSDLLSRSSYGVDLFYTPLRLQLTQPVYMNAIFPSETINAIEGRLEVGLGMDALNGMELLVELRESSGSKPALAQVAVDILDRNPAFSLEIPELAEGSYQLILTLRDSKQALVADMARTIRVLPPAPSGVEWRIDADGVLLRNGEPFLPIGWFTLTPDALGDAASDSNLALLYLGPWSTEAQVLERLDRIHERGGYAIIYPTVKNQRPESITKESITEETASWIRERVRAIMGHPALLGWYVGDEPEFHRVSPKAVAQLREIITSEDPYHPTIVVNGSVNGIRQFARSVDILAPDPYPFFAAGGVSSAMAKVSSLISEASTAARPGQTVWVVPQAHDTRQFNGLGERAPNFHESRNMVWQAVIAGAKGVVWWSWQRVYPNTTDSVIGNAYLARELRRLKPYILAPLSHEFIATAEDPSNFFVSLRQVEEEIALFVVNTSTQTQTVRFELPAYAGRELITIGASTTLKLDGEGRGVATFEPYATYLYLSDAELAGVETIASVQAAIDARKDELRRPGNLAFEENGVQISTFTQGRGMPKPFWMADGYRYGMAWEGSQFTGEDWVQFAWPSAQSFSRVVIWTDSIADARVLVSDDGESWQPVAEIENAQVSTVEINFDHIEARYLQIEILKLRNGQSAPRIWEVEVFNWKEPQPTGIIRVGAEGQGKTL